MATSQNIRIRLKAFDHKLIDTSAREIVETARRTGATVRGPVPLPTKIERFTVLVSPHGDKDARDPQAAHGHLEPDRQDLGLPHAPRVAGGRGRADQAELTAVELNFRAAILGGFSRGRVFPAIETASANCSRCGEKRI